MIKLYDKILLRTGETAYIVEIFEDGKLYLADIDKAEGTETDWIYPSEIERVL